jgi:epoxyqueuosine reductase
VTPERLTVELAERARDLGFDRLRIAAARALDRDARALDRWLDAGRHAGMGWMARSAELRRDPRRVLPGCKSVVSLAWNHGPGGADRSRHAGIARYARGRDYHRVLGTRLSRLAAWLAAASGVPARAFVDSGPLLERAWAEASGLGWIGKNSCVITRDLGSWILLGEILSAAALEPDDGPHEDLCGTCTACLEACPTTAILPDRTVDANRCISYWTIEHRGAVPEEQRAGSGDWLFGCDVCQEVCPWNRRFGREPERPEDAGPDLETLDPIEILGMDERTFRRRYSGTALMRARWDGMRRNACVVLGNRGDRAAIPALERARRDADPVVRSHAAWALERIARPKVEA